MFSNKLSKYLECFPGDRPASIQYCATLLTNENAEINEIPLNDFCHQHDFEYSSSINMQAKDIEKFYGGWNEVEKRYNCKMSMVDCTTTMSQNKSFIVCKISPDVGHGLFLSPEVPVISQGTIVMAYAGILKTPSVDKSMYTNYAMNCDLFFKSEITSILNTESKYCYVDARKIGNLSRFIQHAPMEDELKTMGDPHHIRSKIVTANLISSLTWHLGFPIHCLQAMRDIYPGEQLCISYGSQYFNYFSNEKNSFALFGSTGDIIATTKNLYTTSIETVDNLEVKSLADVPRANIVLHEFQKDFPLTAQPDSMPDYRNYLLDAYRLCFKNYIYCIPAQTEKHDEIVSYLNSCINALSSDNDVFEIKQDLELACNEHKILKPLSAQLLKIPNKNDVFMERENTRTSQHGKK